MKYKQPGVGWLILPLLQILLCALIDGMAVTYLKSIGFLKTDISLGILGWYHFIIYIVGSMLLSFVLFISETIRLKYIIVFLGAFLLIPLHDFYYSQWYVGIMWSAAIYGSLLSYYFVTMVLRLPK